MCNQEQEYKVSLGLLLVSFWSLTFSPWHFRVVCSHWIWSIVTAFWWDVCLNLNTIGMKQKGGRKELQPLLYLKRGVYLHRRMSVQGGFHKKIGWTITQGLHKKRGQTVTHYLNLYAYDTMPPPMVLQNIHLLEEIIHAVLLWRPLPHHYEWDTNHPFCSMLFLKVSSWW